MSQFLVYGGVAADQRRANHDPNADDMQIVRRVRFPPIAVIAGQRIKRHIKRMSCRSSKGLALAVVCAGMAVTGNALARAQPHEEIGPKPTIPSGTNGSLTAPRRTRGRLAFGDLPYDLRKTGKDLKVGVIFTVDLDGSVTDCQVTTSSGIPTFDSLVCKLIQRRFHYTPSKEADGHAVVSQVFETHTWVGR